MPQNLRRQKRLKNSENRYKKYLHSVKKLLLYSWCVLLFFLCHFREPVAVHVEGVVEDGRTVMAVLTVVRLLTVSLTSLHHFVNMNMNINNYLFRKRENLNFFTYVVRSLGSLDTGSDLCCLLHTISSSMHVTITCINCIIITYIFYFKVFACFLSDMS